MAYTGQNSSFRMFNTLRWLLPSAVPLTALLYAAWWNQLPARMATHFGASGQPNGWMARQDSLMFSIILTAILSAIGVAVLSRVRKPDFLAWTVLGLFYFVLGTILWGNDSVIAFNVSGHPVDPKPILILAACMLTFVIAAALLTRRGDPISTVPPFAEETHASPLIAFIMVVPCATLALAAMKVPVPVARIALGAASIGMLAIAAMASIGFRYSFSRAGLEIRLLGFRLRSIPAADIRSYAVDRWNALGGYGIRGLGDRRAYVWCNRGVRIQTTEGEVFLGHNQPQRLVRDLDRITVRSSPATNLGQGTQKVLN